MKREDAPVRFWRKVSIALDPGACWEWLGALERGYDNFRNDNGRKVRAHRWAYEASVGPVPEGLQLDHLCRNRACVKPAHLEAVTQRTNILRGVGATAKHARQTHCEHGHPFNQENTYVYPQGWRTCRPCKRKRDRRYRAAGRVVRNRWPR